MGSEHSKHPYQIKNIIKITDNDFLKASYFSPGKQKIESFGECYIEGQIIHSDVELRIRVSPVLPGTEEGDHGQLCIIKQNRYYVGSGAFCHNWASKGAKCFVLTCAHNFVSVFRGLGEKIVLANSAVYHHAKDGFENSYAISKINKFHIYGDYLNNPEIEKGYDLAIGLLEDKMVGVPYSKTSYWGFIEQVAPVAGDTIRVMGYPGEKNGGLYYMEGTIKEIRAVSKKRKLIIYDNINTSGGQSGSPVYLKRTDSWYVIGVHVGYDCSINANIATALTKHIYDWIIETLDKGFV